MAKQKATGLSRSWVSRIVVIVLIAGGLTAVYFFGKSFQKAKAKANRKDPVNLPNSGQGIPEGWTDQAEALATALHDRMKGLNFYAASEKWERLASPDLTDDMVTAVYNSFNRQYSAESEATLTQWIRSQWAIGAAADAKEDALDRLNRLGLE
jgi:hypothetical protein